MNGGLALSQVADVLFVVVVGLILLGGVAQYALLARLRQKHREVWITLGRRHVFLNDGPEKDHSLWRFIVDRKYRVLADPIVSVLCASLHWLTVLSVAGLIATVVAVLVTEY